MKVYNFSLFLFYTINRVKVNMVEKDKLVKLVLLAERASRYGSLEAKYPEDAIKAIETINLKKSLERLSDTDNSILASSNFTYGL